MTCYMLKPSIFLSSKFHLYKTQSPSWAVKTQLAKELSICSIVILFVHFAILEREINTKLLPITSKSKSLNSNFKKRKKKKGYPSWATNGQIDILLYLLIEFYQQGCNDTLNIDPIMAFVLYLQRISHHN